MGFYWGECNPSFKYHTARADGVLGFGEAAMEAERHGGVTGARSGRALMLPTKRLPLSRRPEDHLADPGSGAGGDGARAWREKKRRMPDNGFPAARSALHPAAAPQARGERAAPRRPGVHPSAGKGGVVCHGGDLPRSSAATSQHPHSKPSRSHRPSRDVPLQECRTSPCLHTRLSCRAPPFPGKKNAPVARKEPGSPGALPACSCEPAAAPGSEQEGSGQRLLRRAPQPARLS